MSEQLVRDLRVLIAQDRVTADIWERQCEEYWPRKPFEAVLSPPERSRSAIRNWINWLRTRANEFEAIVQRAESGQ